MIVSLYSGYSSCSKMIYQNDDKDSRLDDKDNRTRSIEREEERSNEIYVTKFCLISWRIDFKEVYK